MATKRGRKNLSIERLEKREVFSATVMEVEVNDNQAQANAFELDAADLTADLIGTSLNDNDKDWFRFTTPQAGTLSVNVDSPNGEFAALEIENALGTEIFSTDPNDGINSGSVDVGAGETLFVRLRAKDDLAADYSANLTMGDPGGGGGGGGDPGDPPTGVIAESENNDRKQRANPFGFDGGVAQLVGTSTSDNDKDFFTFVTDQDGQLNVTVNSPNGNFAQFQLEDRFGNDLFDTDPNDGINSGSVNIAAGERYYARMRSKNDNAAEYVVDLDISASSGVASSAIPGLTNDGDPVPSGSESDTSPLVTETPTKQQHDIATQPAGFTRQVRASDAFHSIESRATDRVFAELDESLSGGVI